MKNNSSEMKIFYYNKTKNHTSNDTDKMIIESFYSSCGVQAPQELTVKRTQNGKPYIDGKENVYVGVTHTENLVIVAIDSKNFGIDCENFQRKVKYPVRIANKYFSKNEFEYIYPDGNTSGSDQETSMRFLEVWVKKEAYVKYLGTGIKDMPDIDIFALSGRFEKIDYKNNLIYIYRPE